MAQKTKDFTAGTKKYNSLLEEATMDDSEILETEEPETEPVKKKGRPKKQGEPTKTPRITFDAPPEMFDYVKTISIVTGRTISETMQAIVKMHMDLPGNAEIYEKAVELRKALFAKRE